jgi:hypothetical protein
MHHCEMNKIYLFSKLMIYLQNSSFQNLKSYKPKRIKNKEHYDKKQKGYSSLICHRTKT